MSDTDELITQLQARLTARAEAVDAPADLADRGRRGAHRRVARRMAVAGAPVLVVVALVLTFVAGNRSSAPSAGVDAAYVARQVIARLDESDAGGAVLHQLTINLAGGPDAGQRGETWDFPDPRQGHETSFSRQTARDGRVLLLTRDVLRIRRHHARDFTLTVNPVARTWSKGASCYPVHPGLGSFANDRQLRELIAHRRFIRSGTTSIDGQPALRLRLRLPGRLKGAESEVLYVNAQTYRPISETIAVRHGSGPFVETTDWLPATPANRALATRALPIPAGYRKVLSPAESSNRYDAQLIRSKLRTHIPARDRRRLRADLRKLQSCS